jgi:hypothetical protein
VPFTLEDAGGLGGKERKEATRKVETAVGATRALVLDDGNGALSAERDADLLVAVGTGVSATVLGGIQSDNEVARFVHITAGTQSDIVEGEPGVAEPFVVVDGNIPRSTTDNGIMVAAGCMRTSVGVGCDV